MARRRSFIRYTGKEGSLVDACLSAHVTRLPAGWREGLALPAVWADRDEQFLHLIPADMQDGPVRPDGGVTWRLAAEPSGELTLACDDDIPPLLQAYIYTQRVPRLPICVAGKTCYLPATPTHNVTADYYRLCSRWVWLTINARYLPLAEAEDDSLLVCLDVSAGPARRDPPVVRFDVDFLLRADDQIFDADDARPIVNPAAVATYPSLSAMFRELYTGPVPRPPALPPDLAPPPPFAWESILTPQPRADRRYRPRRAAEATLRTDLHVARIADKLAYLRAADRSFLVEGAASHLYRMEPRLLPTERQALETEEGFTIPPAYAAFLEGVGSGGVGPAGGSWLFRVQASSAGRASAHRITRGPEPNRLAQPFPHATAWMPGGIQLEKIDRSDYLHPCHNRGTVGLARLPESGGHDLVLLVVNGPERGHLWLDRRERGGGSCRTCGGGRTRSSPGTRACSTTPSASPSPSASSCGLPTSRPGGDGSLLKLPADGSGIKPAPEAARTGTPAPALVVAAIEETWPCGLASGLTNSVCPKNA
jgi:hypothetical protein